MAKLGVIDLGTNTFHLLIAEVTQQEIKEIYRERIFVKLAEKGIHKIGDAAFQRATNAIATFKNILDRHDVGNVNAFGTEGLRRASNGQDFIQEIKSKYKLDITIISGDEEARLIHKGVMLALGKLNTKSLIMDIGGGSVEFIICDNETVYWAQSFKLGVAVLFNNFHQKDPISQREIDAIHQHLDITLLPLKTALIENPTATLIGASGTFDVLENILADENQHSHYSMFPAKKFISIYDRIIKSTLSERLANPEIPNDRAELITVAVVLLNYTVQLANIQNFIVSSYAMKEGMLASMQQKDIS